jgi:hypothetical protein
MGDSDSDARKELFPFCFRLVNGRITQTTRADHSVVVTRVVATDD